MTIAHLAAGNHVRFCIAEEAMLNAVDTTKALARMGGMAIVAVVKEPRLNRVVWGLGVFMPVTPRFSQA